MELENEKDELNKTLLDQENLSSNKMFSHLREQWPKIIGIEQIFQNMEIVENEENGTESGKNTKYICCVYNNKLIVLDDGYIVKGMR